MNGARNLADAVLRCELDRAEWTHEAHITFSMEMVRRRGAVEALGITRTAICRYNEASGVANTDNAGYHETLTVYFSFAVAHLLDTGLDLASIIEHPLVARHAPLLAWERSVLFSGEARRSWIEPHSPLPFPVTVCDGSPL